MGNISPHSIKVVTHFLRFIFIAESEFSERGIGKFCKQGSTGGCNVYKNEPRSECLATNDFGKTARRIDIAFKIIRLQRRYLYEDIKNDRFSNRS